MKTLNRFLMTMALLITAVTGAWAAPRAFTLSMDYELDGYQAKTFYNLTANKDGILPTADSDLRYRESYGLYNYGSGNRGTTINLPVKAGEKLILEFQDTQNRSVTINSISNCSKDETATVGDFLVYTVTADASTLDVNVGRGGCIYAILVMQPSTSCIPMTYNINNMLTFSGETWSVAQSLAVNAADGFALTSFIKFDKDVITEVVDNAYSLNAKQYASVSLASTFTPAATYYTESDLVKPTYTFVADEKGYAITDNNITVSPALDENGKISLLSDMPVTVTPQTGYKLQSLTVGSLIVTGPDETTGAFSFTSGTEDLNATYYLVRDLSVQTSVQVVNGEGTEQNNFVLTKSGETYAYVDQPAYVLTDLLTNEALDQTDLECTLQKKNGETWEDYTAATPVPGEYRMKITPKVDGRYTNTGDVIVTGAFTLYFAQTVEVRADGFATFISDDL